MYFPQIDVCERPHEVVVLVEVPGVDRGDVTISWKDNILVISGQKRHRPLDSSAAYLCLERTYGPFRREIAIGIPIDHRKARAELRDGLMKIRLPKMTDQEDRDTIPIE